MPTRTGDALYFVRYPTTAPSIFRAARANNFAAAAELTELESPLGQTTPVPTADDLGLYYARVTTSGFDIWFARRTAPGKPYTTFGPVTELNTGRADYPGWVHRSGCRLYFTSDRDGTYRVYSAQKPR